MAKSKSRGKARRGEGQRKAQQRAEQLAEETAASARKREEDAEMVELLLRSGRRDAAVRLMRDTEPTESKAPLRLFSVVHKAEVEKGRAPGSTPVAGAESAETAAQLTNTDQLYVLESLSTFLRPDKKIRARQEARSRDATEFGSAGMLTPQRRAEYDALGEQQRALVLPHKKLFKAAGGTPGGEEAKLTALYALRQPPQEVIAAGKDTPTRDSLTLLLAELGLVKDTPLPSGAMAKGWHVATWMVRFIIGGAAAVSLSASAKDLLEMHALSIAERRHVDLVYMAFDPRVYKMPAAERPTAGMNLVWTYYLSERRDEELHLSRLLFTKLHQIRQRSALGTAAHRGKLVVRYLFAHWLLRLVTGIYTKEPETMFLMSPDSHLVELCGNDELGPLFEKILSGKAVSKGGGDKKG